VVACSGRLHEAAARIAGYHHLHDQPLWRLLAADHAPKLDGLLQTLLLHGDRRLPASILQ